MLESDTLRWQWVVLLSCASQHEGVIPSAQVAAISLRTTEARARVVIAKLAQAILLDPVEGGYFAPHNWIGRQYKSDVSTDRVKKFRKRQRNVSQGVSETHQTTETETDTEPEVDQRSLTSLQITTSEGFSVEDVKAKGWTPPRHCAVSRDKKHVYIWTNTPEWDAYAADFRTVHQQEPQPNSHGGKWFAAQGEAA